MLFHLTSAAVILITPHFINEKNVVYGSESNLPKSDLNLAMIQNLGP